jgi:hypothetical protein
MAMKSIIRTGRIVAASAAESWLTSNGSASEQPTYSLRSSVWKLIDGRWQMVFNQGTLSKEPQ